MRFYNSINETMAKEIEYDDVEREYFKIRKDCKQYFKLLGNKTPLYRTISEKIFASDSYLKKQVRQDRKPRSSLVSPEATKVINDLLQKMGHNRRDQAVTVTPDYDHADVFTRSGGQVYYFFPIGKFSYSWVPTIDWNFARPGWNVSLFTTLKLELQGKETDLGFDRAYELLEQQFEQIKTDKGFTIAYHEGYEIWFKCKEYYLIPTNSDLGKMVNKNGKR